MIIPKKIYSALMVALAAPLVFGSLPAQTAPEKFAWGEPVNGLEMSLSVDPATVLPLHTPPPLCCT